MKTREAIHDKFERSGMTGTAFTGHHGIKYQTFASWRGKRKQAQEAGPEEMPRFLLVEPEQSAPWESATDARIEIERGGGPRLRIRCREEASLAADLREKHARHATWRNKRVFDYLT